MFFHCSFLLKDDTSRDIPTVWDHWNSIDLPTLPGLGQNIQTYFLWFESHGIKLFKQKKNQHQQIQGNTGTILKGSTLWWDSVLHRLWQILKETPSIVWSRQFHGISGSNLLLSSFTGEVNLVHGGATRRFLVSELIIQEMSNLSNLQVTTWHDLTVQPAYHWTMSLTHRKIANSKTTNLDSRQESDKKSHLWISKRSPHRSMLTLQI